MNERLERIKMELRLRGSSLTAIARELGVNPAIMTNVCKGVRRSRRIEAVIAQRLGRPLEKLWPEYYRKENER